MNADTSTGVIKRKVAAEMYHAKQAARTPKTEFFKSPREYHHLSSLMVDLRSRYATYTVIRPDKAPDHGYMIGLYVASELVIPIVVPANFPERVMNMFGDHIPLDTIEVHFLKYQPQVEVIDDAK